MDNPTKQIIIDIANNNPGAYAVISQLMWFSGWFKMMQHLKDNNIIGSKLWAEFKDVYHSDIMALGGNIQKQISLAQNEKICNIKHNGTSGGGAF